MSRVQAEVEKHYRSGLVERIRAQVESSARRNDRPIGQAIWVCYGVERAIDLAYTARKVFPDRRISLLGEIIHNLEVNAQLAAMGIRYLPAHPDDTQIQELAAEDVVIVPAFGAKVSTVDAIKERGCQIVDTTCGDVMSVWKRVRQNASEEVTSIIHGKSAHEETMATASRALGTDGKGTLPGCSDLEQTDRRLPLYPRRRRQGRLSRHFESAHSPGFNPDIHLERRRGEPDYHAAERDRGNPGTHSSGDRLAGRPHSKLSLFRHDLWRDAERQDALFQLLDETLDLLIVVGATQLEHRILRRLENGRFPPGSSATPDA
jgi:4-hydroxy-3-methylbut-2-enyl diphosphate reductase